MIFAAIIEKLGNKATEDSTPIRIDLLEGYIEVVQSEIDECQRLREEALCELAQIEDAIRDYRTILEKLTKELDTQITDILMKAINK